MINFNHGIGNQHRFNRGISQLLWHDINKIKSRLTLNLSWTEELGGPVRMRSGEGNPDR